MEAILVKKLLMIPGPTQVSKVSLKQMSLPVQPHYGDYWKKKYNSIISKIQKIFFTKTVPLILAGSGTYCMEAAISSALQPNDQVVVIKNGYWAERAIEIFKSWKVKVHIINLGFRENVDTIRIEKFLKSKKNIKMVFFVHVETSTGSEIDINSITKICKKYNVLSLIDSVGGLGGTNIKFDLMNIDFLATSSQKCLESPAGLGFLCISNRARNIIKSNKRSLGWTLNVKNLENYKKKWKLWHPHGPTTAPVSLYLALEKSIDLILKEGLNKRFDRHKKIKNYVRTQLAKLNLELFIKDEKYASNTLTTFLLPKKIKLRNFISVMNKKYNIIISGDLGYIDARLVRIAHMGRSANLKNISKTLSAIKKIIN